MQTDSLQVTHLLALDGLGHITLGNELREALCHSRLAHSWLADEAGVVLRAAAQDLCDTLDLGLAANDWVQLALQCAMYGTSASAPVMQVRRHTARPTFLPTKTPGSRRLTLTSLACVVRLVPYSSRVGSLLEPGPEPPPAVAPTASWLSPTMRMTWERTLSPCTTQHATRLAPEFVSHVSLQLCSQEASKPSVRHHDASGTQATCKKGHLHTQRLQHPRGNAITLPQHTQQNVLCADVVVA